MIKDGIGGGNTTTGLVFETKADLKTLLNGLKNYNVDKENNVFYKDKLVGMIFVKNGLYKFLEKNKVNWQDYLSKKLLPDDSIYVILNNTFYVIECKSILGGRLIINSYYKTDNIAHAILNYERALILQPDNADIRANLDIARSKTIDKVTPIPEVFFITWIHTLSNSMSSDKWAKTSIACFLLFLILLGVFLLGKRTSFKKTGFIGAIFMLFACVVSNVFSAQQKQSRLERNQAIVLIPSITVRSTPSESGTSLFVIHEGHKVEIKDNSMHEWKEIELEDGKVGWIPASSIEII